MATGDIKNEPGGGHTVYARHQHTQNVGQRKDVARLTGLRPKGKEGIGRLFYFTQIGQAMLVCIAWSRKPTSRRLPIYSLPEND